MIVDLTRGLDRRLCSRLLDAVQGSSSTVYADWLKEQAVEVTVSVKYAALHPFRGYRNAIRDELPDTVAQSSMPSTSSSSRATHSTRSALSRSTPARSPRSPSSAGRYASGALRSCRDCCIARS
ncbi:MAG: transposase [Actinomycetota bacterium]|nr:transposase [Actinomycetota bacterium]